MPTLNEDPRLAVVLGAVDDNSETSAVMWRRKSWCFSSVSSN